MAVCCFFTVGTKGRNKGEFANLQGVAASDTGNVLIADSNNQCVQVKSDMTAVTNIALIFKECTKEIFACPPRYFLMMAILRVVSAYEVALQGNFNGQPASLSTPTVTSSLLTMTPNGSAFSPVMVNLR